MDSIIGEFTITSSSDPAIFHTTFARSVNLDEGYELGLKSIYHGPVKNLVYNKFNLYNKNSVKEMELAPRFYRAPSDILLGIHQAIASVAPVPLLYEKDGQMKMTMEGDHWIEVNEAMFLNQNFKYALYDPETQPEKRKKKNKKTIEQGPFESIREKIDKLKNIMLGKDLEAGIRESVDYLEAKVTNLEENITTLKNLGEWKKSPETKAKYIKIFEKVNDLVIQFNALFDSIGAGDQRDFQGKALKMSNSIHDIERMVLDLETSIAADNTSTSAIEGHVVILKKAYDQTNYFLEGLTPVPEKTYSIDTSQMVTRQKQLLQVTEISVSMKHVEKTILAFLYASPVENSLINNKESRMLTPIPVTSKKGYNYVEFAQPLYRRISVRHFMDISFEILDKNGKKVEFNLYGDDLDQENREYPTILNLHIRRAI